MSHTIFHLDSSGDFSIENAILESANAKIIAPEKDALQTASQSEIVLFTSTRIDSRVLDQLHACRVLIRYGIGLDKVDIPEATRRGIAVCNVPDFCIDEMADHTLALALGLQRKIFIYRNLDWQARRGAIQQLRGASFVTIGFGRIARAVLQRAAAFGCRVAAADPFVAQDEMCAAGVVPLNLEDAFAQADILSLHCPLTPHTEQIINDTSLRKMQRSCILLNTGRGELVNTAALLQALQKKTITGAGLDVTDPEPLPPEHPLHLLDNVIITPHVAWYSEESQRTLRRKVAEEVLRALRGEPLRNQVNPRREN
jgi:D-3-phosphoglycerate dehydrogenase